MGAVELWEIHPSVKIHKNPKSPLRHGGKYGILYSV